MLNDDAVRTVGCKMVGIAHIRERGEKEHGDKTPKGVALLRYDAACGVQGRSNPDGDGARPPKRRGWKGTWH